jgi:hypothetical protein
MIVGRVPETDHATLTTIVLKRPAEKSVKAKK